MGYLVLRLLKLILVDFFMRLNCKSVERYEVYVYRLFFKVIEFLYKLENGSFFKRFFLYY